MNIYTNYDDIKDNFVLLPNNAIIYPLLKSKNPFPVDWMQHDEYIGCEDVLYSKLRQVLDTKNIYVIIDKYESGSLAFDLVEKKYYNDSKRMAFDLFLKKYNVEKYDYMKLIMNKCEELPYESKYFRVFRSKK